MFVPLAHPPGHAQADFGEADAVIAGVKRRAHFFAMELPRMSTAASPYSTDQLEHLAAIIERTAPGVTVSREDLGQHLLDLLGAVGIDDGTEYAAAFREFAALEPSHAELAERFRAIAVADDPLNSELCSGIVLGKLNTAARGKWARRMSNGLINRPHPLRGISSDMLSDKDLAEVREMALHLANFHQSFVRRGQPNKSDQDTLLDGIADIYVEFAKLDCHRYDLPHAKNSRFVKFVHLALRPFFGLTEASLASISKRWKRLKDAHNRAI